MTHKECVLQRVSLGAFSDVTVFLGMRQTIEVEELLKDNKAMQDRKAWKADDSSTTLVIIVLKVVE